MKKLKNVPQKPQMWHIYATKVWDLYHKVWQPPRNLGKGWGNKQEVTQWGV